MNNSPAARIAALNDAFRKNLLDRRLGRTYLTGGVAALGDGFVQKALAAVIAFDAFTAENDPHHEHDFGACQVDGERLFFKIAYFDRRDPDFGAVDPSDPTTTERVLTIMLAAEY